MDIFWRRHEEERKHADLDSHRVPLDLNALIPIPRRVLRKGFAEAGQEWMWANWVHFIRSASPCFAAARVRICWPLPMPSRYRPRDQR